MGRFLMIVACGGALSACADTGALDRGLSGLMFRPISEAVAILGPPDRSSSIEPGKTLYYWETNRSTAALIGQPTTTTGIVGGQPVAVQSTTYRAETYNVDCRVRIGFDDSRVIRGYDWQGSNEGCRPYIQALERAGRR